MGQFRRKRILLLVCIALLGLLCLQLSSGTHPWSPQAGFSSDGFLESNLDVRKTLDYHDYRFRHTQAFARTFNLDWSAFENKSLHDKCFDFFSYMKQADPAWQFNAVRHNAYEKDVTQKHHYMLRKYKVLKKKKERAGEPVTDDITDADLDVINGWLQELVDAAVAVEQTMADDATMLRIFAHCFLAPEQNDLASSPQLQPLYRWFGERMVRLLLGAFPMLERPDGTVLLDSFAYESPVYNRDAGILDHYRRHISGAGIVITGSTRFVRPIVKLIRVLRVLGNTLPIQIVYRGDILIRSKAVLYAVASQSKEEMLDPVYSDIKLLEKMYPGFGLDHHAFRSLEYPPQDITLINIDRTIHPDHKSAMAGYNNKILALFFSTFEKVLLYDADSVPLVPPQEILDAPEFTGSGAYFFQDRSLRDQNDWIETNLFSKLMPHRSDKLDMAMGVKPVSNHTMGNPYMVGWRHYQEAGLLAIDKRRHFGMFMALFALPLWGQVVQALVWGDKEMYWLALSMMGDELYHMNQYGAASVGEITQLNHLKAYNRTEANELCSSHPGHINLAGKILWVNSGFSYCKKNGYVRDSKKFPFSKFAQISAVEELYKRPLAIRHAIVPPPLPMLRLPGGSPDILREDDFVKLFNKRKKDVDQMDADQVEGYHPQKGWVKSSTCSSYQYCAYDAIESYLEPNTLDKSGKLFTFLPEEAAMFDFLGTMWMSANRPSKVKEALPPGLAENRDVTSPTSSPLNPASGPRRPTPPKWRERPEKLKNDVNEVINKLILKQNKSGSVIGPQKSTDI